LENGVDGVAGRSRHRRDDYAILAENAIEQ